MIHIEIDESYCKGCKLCIAICPKNVLEVSDKLSPKGVYPPVAKRPEDCINCKSCEMICPDFAIEVKQKENPASQTETTKKNG